MLSEMFYKLWANGLIQMAVFETIYMTVIATALPAALEVFLGCSAWGCVCAISTTAHFPVLSSYHAQVGMQP